MSVLRHDMLPRVACMLCMLGHVTTVCNQCYDGSSEPLSIRVVELCCDSKLYSTYLHVIRTCNLYCYVWDPTPSCLFLVALLMGKCLLVLPLSHGTLLLLRNTWDDRHVSFFAPVSVPSGKCHAVSTEVLLACYSLDSLAADRHVHCWVMYACPCKLVP